MDAVGPGGTVMGYASSDRSPYEETLNGARMDKALRRDWPAFDPRIAGTYRGFGLLNRFLADLPGARRSAHPDASMVAVGPLAGTLVEPHRLGQALGEGAPLDAVTVLHYAEAVADIPGKRRISYEMPVLGANGRTIWKAATDFDSNGILDCFAIEGQPDAVETIARAYVATGRHREGVVGAARCHLFDTRDIVAFGVGWLERQFGSAHPLDSW